jgi:hypothetical protein
VRLGGLLVLTVESSGLALGLHAERVSEGEQKMLDKRREVLSAPAG